jgi:carbamoyltransferase
MKKDMYILGISESHNATAALIKNGKLVAVASEERFSRKKTHTGYPKRAIKFVLKEAGISANKLDAVVSSFQTHSMYSLYEIDEVSSASNSNKTGVFSRFISRVDPVITALSYGVPLLRKLRRSLFPFYRFATQFFLEGKRKEYISKILGISPEKIHFAPHHECHIYASYAFRTIETTEPVLLITLDGEGDRYCAGVNVFKEGHYEKVSHTPNFRSIGKLYLAVTTYLGMRPNEHEYKVMGMAPYADTKMSQQVCEILEPLLWVNSDLTFGSSMDDRLFLQFLEKHLKGYRFDYICGGIQLFTERLIVEWVKKIVEATGIHNIIFGGGVFMNVKVNKLLCDLTEVEKASFCPSSGDESTAIGAAFYGHELAKLGTVNLSLPISAVGPLSLGPGYSEANFLSVLKKKSRMGKFEVLRPKNIEKEVARLLSNGEIVAVMYGKMEFGARALGNRSILANPNNPNVVRVLNQKIKHRDFWMPFALSLLEEYAGDYIVNPKGVENPYMMVAFATHPSNYENIQAGTHPQDCTTRPQIVKKTWNKKYWTVIDEFRKLTGIAGVLNTSFNLHGEPIVCSPEDALHTMENSALTWLATETLLIKKAK